jgi:transketolase
MRLTLDKTLCELAKKDKRIWCLTADVGYKMFEDFPKDRFLNVGIAEQNMIGIAAGLALCGKIVYCYSICNFLILRPYEFIRNDIAYQDLPVRLIGVGGVNEYPDMGISHNCPRHEDLKLIRTLPNFGVFAPDTTQELKQVLKFSVKHKHPMYIRIRRK